MQQIKKRLYFSNQKTINMVLFQSFVLIISHLFQQSSEPFPLFNGHVSCMTFDLFSQSRWYSITLVLGDCFVLYPCQPKRVSVSHLLPNDIRSLWVTLSYFWSKTLLTSYVRTSTRCTNGHREFGIPIITVVDTCKRHKRKEP